MVWAACFIASGDFLIPEKEHEQSAHIHTWTQSYWYKSVLIPLICLFPLWIRFSQCLRKYMDTGQRMPNLANAFKYAMSQTVTLFGAFHPLYLMHMRNEDFRSVNLADDTEHDTIVIGRYRSNTFQVRVVVEAIAYCVSLLENDARAYFVLFRSFGRVCSYHRHFTASFGMYTWIGVSADANGASLARD